jgi:hypothetical protein
MEQYTAEAFIFLEYCADIDQRFRNALRIVSFDQDNSIVLLAEELEVVEPALIVFRSSVEEI